MNTGDTITPDGLAYHINDNLKEKIQDYVHWWLSAPPNFDDNWDNILQNTDNLAAITSDMIGNKGEWLNAASFYKNIQATVNSWSTVRPFSVIGYKGNNTNGGTPTYTKVYSEMRYANIKVAHEDILGRAGQPFTAGSIASAETMNQLINNIFRQWKDLPIYTYESKNCHGNCHDNCHGSGGWR